MLKQHHYRICFLFPEDIGCVSPNVPNASIIKHGTGVGAILAIVCLPKYRFTDNTRYSTWTCSLNGQWQGDVSMKCYGKSFLSDTKSYTTDKIIINDS